MAVLILFCYHCYTFFAPGSPDDFFVGFHFGMGGRNLDNHLFVVVVASVVAAAVAAAVEFLVDIGLFFVAAVYPVDNSMY